MPLIESCPNCGHKMSGHVLVCAECGYELVTGNNAFGNANHGAKLKRLPRRAYDPTQRRKAAADYFGALIVMAIPGVIVAGIIFGTYKYAENNLREQDQKEFVQNERRETPSYSLSAQELYREYSANEVRADGKYKGSVVVISGTVESIGKDMLGSAYIVIKGGDDVFGVQCMFASSRESSVASMYKGESVSIKGEVSGKMGNVILRNCESR
jgi:hypothetical protein